MPANRSSGHESAGTEPPRRLTLSEIARAQLAALERVPREHSTIGLSRNARGATQIEVSVRTGDEGVDTLADALELARRLYDELREAYPLEETPVSETAEKAKKVLERQAKSASEPK